MFRLRSALSRTAFSTDILEIRMKKSVLGISIGAVCIAVAGILVVYLRAAALPGRDAADITINGQTIRAEVVSTESAREKGLGGRSGIGADEGMLFVFERPGLHGFWMKDMHFPIDIVWMADGKIVSIEENVDPQIGASESELKNYFPETFDDRVLELQAGRVKTLGARVGDSVTIINSGTQ